MDNQKILDEAYEAASAAILAKFKSGESEQPFNCGFAWVNIDGRHPLAFYCRKRIREAGARLEGREKHVAEQNAKQQYGDKAYTGGWQFWKPGRWPTSQEAGRQVYQQDMDFHFAGADAFAKKLAEYGIRATVGTRLD